MGPLLHGREANDVRQQRLRCGFKASQDTSCRAFLDQLPARESKIVKETKDAPRAADLSSLFRFEGENLMEPRLLSSRLAASLVLALCCAAPALAPRSGVRSRGGQRAGSRPARS